MTNHVLSGALIGALARRPVPAFALGVVSHFVLDAVPHWGKLDGGPEQFLRVAVRDGLGGLATIAVLAAVTPRRRRAAVLAGMAGAALPDLDKPAALWFGRSPWPDLVNRVHAGIQDEAPDRFAREMTAMGLLAAASLVAIRSGKSR